MTAKLQGMTAKVLSRNLFDEAELSTPANAESGLFTSDRSTITHGGHVRVPRLLYLGYAFPPGVAALHPGVNPAGHALETRMIIELRRGFEVRSVGVLPFEPPALEAADPQSGLAHEVVLVEKPPELTHRIRALRRLKAEYCAWRSAGWRPDMVLVYNLSPIYNQFLLWLRRQADCPKLVLLLLDSPNLGRTMSAFKRLRHRFKPMTVPDNEMLDKFDACVGLSREVGRYFSPHGVPFLWMPGGCTPDRACSEPNGFAQPGGPKRFGYFGALGAHAGVKPMVEAFLGCELPGSLEICGYGKAAGEFAEIARRDPRIRFHGLLSPAECLCFGRSCDMLINPRPASHGNENNFASKLFDYALTGRAILTAKLSGVEEVLGSEAFYFDPHDFQHRLGEQLSLAAALPRAELHRRGLAIQKRVMAEFSWEGQGARLRQFLESICAATAGRGEISAALAA